MTDGLKGYKQIFYKIKWGKWLTSAGIICALVVYVVSAFVGLFPKLNISGINDKGTYGPSVIFTQGFWNLKFYRDPTTAIHNDVLLSTSGIVMIVFMAFSIILPLLGLSEAKHRLFLKSANNIFIWFLSFLILVSILMSVAVFLGHPSILRNPENIFHSYYFDYNNGSKELGNLWLKPKNNYWILLGLTIFGAVSILVLGTLTSKKMFFKQALAQ